MKVEVRIGSGKFNWMHLSFCTTFVTKILKYIPL